MRPSCLVATLGVDQLGGTNAVSAFIIQTMARTHRVRVVSWAPQDPGRADYLFDTRLQQEEIEWICVPRPWRELLDRLPVSHYLLRLHAVMRLARQSALPDDLLLSAHNEMDLGRGCVQYIHYPWSSHPRPDCSPEWYNNPFKGAIMRSYYALCRLLSGYRVAAMKMNISLANSGWTARRLSSCGIEACEVVYPPVIGRFDPQPWQSREVSMIAVGRFAPDKRIDRMIRIVERVREHHPECKLHLVGVYEAEQPAYTALVRSLLATRSWVIVHEKLPRSALLALLCRQRYGLHAMEDEHFGMAVAEMVSAGCLPFVPRSGGPPEIVDRHEALLYTDEDEAVARILAVLDSPSEQMRLRQALEPMASRFSEETFARSLLQATVRLSDGAASRPSRQ